MHRSASRLTRILACAAVPVMLAVAGCSSDSDGKSDADGSTTPTRAPSPTVAPAKFSALPDACKTVSGKTVDSMVPKAKVKGGTEGKSSDISTRGSCSWNGLEDKGVKGSQYRWLDVSLMRYDSDTTLGSGAKRAGEYYTKELAGAQGTESAKDVKTAPGTGIGNEASTITYTLKKTDATFSYATVVARTENVVITLTYNGTGYAGATSPSPADLAKDAVSAAKEAVAAVSGGAGGSEDSGGGDASPSAPSGKPESSGAAVESDAKAKSE
ncbi:DUF3558 domain-containing protein [Streptomyces sp. NPDC059096]|uniref:DUF3558 domain-containing protein n=1 Tax=unclassified Streptomyces TaxID=2593676 RepID=UPI0036B79573